MSYTQSVAVTGRGTVIAINTGTSGSPNWTPIFEITDAKVSGRQASILKATNLQSSQEEFITSLPDPGMFECSGNRVASDPGQLAVDAAFNASGTSGATKQFKVTAPLQGSQVTAGDSVQFNAVVQEWSPFSNLTPTGIITFTLKIKITGGWTFTAGS